MEQKKSDNSEKEKEGTTGASSTPPLPAVVDIHAPPSIYNKQGRLRSELITPLNLNSIDLDRKAHDPALTSDAKVAIAALRDVKDEADGWARLRDLKGIEKAKKIGTGGLLEAAEAVVAAGSPATTEEETMEEEEGDGGRFCSTCFTPMIPDPRPEQLFIWLHAMRCKCFSCSVLPDRD